MRVAIVHDYLTQRGGAERVVLSMLKAFPDAPVYTSVFEPAETFPEFGLVDVRTLPINRFGMLRRHHRWALPILAASFSRLRIDADVTLCSSSGWAHGAHVTGLKIVYCHSPAKWLYRIDDYAPRLSPSRFLAGALAPPLRRWDRSAALTADRYLTNSETIRDQVATVYSIDAEVLHAPTTLDPAGELEPVPDIRPGYFLAVSRLLPYKNIDVLLGAFAELHDERLVVVGVGPEAQRLHGLAAANTCFVGTVGDPQLRWLYANSSALLSAAYEDYGLTPLEAASFGKPAVVLRAGGFIETVSDRATGLFFAEATPEAARKAVREFRLRAWDAHAIMGQASAYAETTFVERLRAIVLKGRDLLPVDDKKTDAGQLAVPSSRARWFRTSSV